MFNAERSGVRTGIYFDTTVHCTCYKYKNIKMEDTPFIFIIIIIIATTTIIIISSFFT